MNSGVIAVTPPSPCTGSIRIAAVSALTLARTSFSLPNGTWSEPSTFGA